MLESKKHRPNISSSNNGNIRESWLGLFAAFCLNVKSFSRRLFRVGSTRISGRLDEKIQSNVSKYDNSMMMESKTREEVYSSAKFEWVKTERAGDVCDFQKFEEDAGVEYIVFEDNSRLRTDLLGDVVLIHADPSAILGRDMIPQSNSQPNVFDQLPLRIHETRTPVNSNSDPVVSILEKTKKKTEKINISITVKIPSPDLYQVVRENFDNTDEVLLENVMQQVQESVLREAVKRELQNIYSKRKKP
jgi:hypothetical protein